MKKLALILIFTLGIVAVASADTNDTLTLEAGKQQTAKKSKLKVKFVAVTEDSRCPDGVQCIWAGNAKIKVEIIGRHGDTKTFEFNTTMGPKGDSFAGWAINLDSLTPMPKAGQATDPKSYTAKFTITRLKR